MRYTPLNTKHDEAQFTVLYYEKIIFFRVKVALTETSTTAIYSGKCGSGSVVNTEIQAAVQLAPTLTLLNRFFYYYVVRYNVSLIKAF